MITQTDLHPILAKFIPQARLSFVIVANRLLCDPVTEDPSYQPAPEDRPGGFQWGQVLLALLVVMSFGIGRWLVLCSFHSLCPLSTVDRIYVPQAGDGDAEGDEEEEEE